MKAAILAGGKGTRLGALGKRIPKAMIKIQGKEIIWYIIKILKKNGFNQIILPLGYKGNLIKRYFSKNTKIFKGVSIDLINTGNNTTELFQFHYDVTPPSISSLTPNPVMDQNTNGEYLTNDASVTIDCTWDDNLDIENASFLSNDINVEGRSLK